jgi:hypothetical protein
MSNTYRTFILYKSRSKTVLKLGKNLRTTLLTYIIIVLLRREGKKHLSLKERHF